MGIARILCKPPQGHGALQCNQRRSLERLVLDIISKVWIVRCLSEVPRGSIAEAAHELSDSDEHAVSLVALR